MIWLACHVKMECVNADLVLIGKIQNAVKIILAMKSKLLLLLFLILFLLVAANGFNQKCAASEECDKSKNLVCRDGVCQCKDASIYWNERSAFCCRFLKIIYRIPPRKVP